MPTTWRRWAVIAGVRSLAFLIAFVAAYLACAPVAYLLQHPLLDPLAARAGGHTWLTSPLAIAATLLGLLLLALLPALAGANGLADRWLAVPSAWPQRRTRLLVSIGLLVIALALVRFSSPPALVFVGAAIVLQAPWLARGVIRAVPAGIRLVRDAWQGLRELWAAFRSAPVWKRLRRARSGRKPPSRGSNEV